MMKIISITTLLFLSLYAWGRKPAVEDFVGLEMPDQKTIPTGTEPLFNLESELKAHQGNQTQISTIKHESSFPLSPELIILGIGFLMLPIGIYALLISKLKKQAQEESIQNITDLENFRAKKEEKENIRKAS